MTEPEKPQELQVPDPVEPIPFNAAVTRNRRLVLSVFVEIMFVATLGVTGLYWRLSAPETFSALAPGTYSGKIAGLFPNGSTGFAVDVPGGSQKFQLNGIYYQR